jgi:preprotein translocase subunit SecA
LFSKNVRDIMLELGETLIDDLIQILQNNQRANSFKYPYSLRRRVSYLLHALNISFDSTIIDSNYSLEELRRSFYQQLWSAYSTKELQFWFYDQNLFRQYEKLIILKYIDNYWSKHLENINFIRDAVAWEVYAQRDPFLLYQEETYRSLNSTFKHCRDAIFYDLLTSEVKI